MGYDPRSAPVALKDSERTELPIFSPEKTSCRLRAPAVLSDADADYLKANIARNGLNFDAVLCSESLGCYKPHESTFLAVCDALSVAPSTVTYVGDGPLTDVQGARHVGMYAIWIDRGIHEWPPDVPPPEHTIASLSELVAVLRSD